MSITVILPSALVEYAGGRHTLNIEGHAGMSVTELLDHLTLHHPAVVRRVRDETGCLRRHVNVFIDGTESRANGAETAPVPAGAVVHIIPAVSGG